MRKLIVIVGGADAVFILACWSSAPWLVLGVQACLSLAATLWVLTWPWQLRRFYRQSDAAFYREEEEIR